jgi:MFS transporter, SP family, solute carrier family 2 (myo-inositol transporter), member 13
MSQTSHISPALDDSAKVWSIRFLLFIAGLGGLLYGIDVGIIAGALPYLEATSKLSANELSYVVAAVLLGSVISTLFAGLLADLMGRKGLMALSGLLFVASIPLIALSNGLMLLLIGRLLQGISAGLIGVVVPLYLAECLSAATRGKGTGIFQWLLTLGIVAAAFIAIFFSMWLDAVKARGDAQELFHAQDLAWRSIFWVSLPPGVLFVIGSLLVTESPRWLFRRGRKDAALAALLRSRTEQQATVEIKEMEEAEAAEKAKSATAGGVVKESLLRRRYVVPFLLACVILACNQATGANSIIGYHATILIQAGLSDVEAHWGYVILTSVNFLVTMLGVALVDRKGRKFLLSLGSAGIILSLICVAVVFHRTEKQQVDCSGTLQRHADALAKSEPKDGEKFTISFKQPSADELLSSEGEAGKTLIGKPSTLVVIYSYGDYHAATKVVRSDDSTAKPLEITREGCVPANRVISFFSNPFANLEAARTAPLKIDRAYITPVPSRESGWLTAFFTFCFMAFFAVGPGVCVWLALSELMPTRIRSNGMSIALLLNQAVSTTIAAVFLPTVGKYGYSTMFFAFAGFTVIYFITAAFFLPETKGKTLEEIESYFSGKK